MDQATSAETVGTAEGPRGRVAGEGARGRARRTTLASASSWILLIGVTVFGVATDLWTKSWAFANVARNRDGTPRAIVVERARVLDALEHGRGLGSLTPPDRMHVVAGGLDFTLVLNPGAVFGIGAGQRVFFVVFTGAAIGFALWVFARWTRPRDWVAHVGLGLLLAGGLGNLYDRVMYACVRDFIHPLPGRELPFGLRWPNNGSAEIWPWVSNVADAYLIVGIVLILWHSWRHQPEERSRASASAA